MALNTKFELYKIKREIKKSGVSCEFLRHEKNKFGEPTNELISLKMFPVIYHEQNSNIQVVTGDTTQIRTKKIPMVMIPYEEFILIGLKTGDIAKINDKKFLVTGIVNIFEFDIVIDISLEVFDSGEI